DHPREIDAVDDRGFEYASRDLLVRDGRPARRAGAGSSVMQARAVRLAVRRGFPPHDLRRTGVPTTALTPRLRPLKPLGIGAGRRHGVVPTGEPGHTVVMGADPGLFTPASVTWQMHGDPMMWVAGIRALYLQALHPRAVRGVMQNSDFGRDAWGRLMRTAHFVGTTTYGTTEAAERAGARVRKIHSMLTATDPDTGERYGVGEPELLLSVRGAGVDPYLQARRRSGSTLTAAQAARYPAEPGVSARRGAPAPAAVRASRAELAAYFEKVRPELTAGPEARAVDDFLLRPPTH